ncbi:MAG: hypothetical protein SV429_01235 [Pseudomonadota bacterium]|nr:hypothetical protein [Pseudomonadota bacterium]
MEAKSAQDDYDQVKQDLQELRNDLSKLAHTVSESQKSEINSLRDEIRRESLGVIKQVRQKGDETLRRAKDTGEKTIHDVESNIEERPFLSIVLMFLAGVLVGKLLDR